MFMLSYVYQERILQLLVIWDLLQIPCSAELSTKKTKKKNKQKNKKTLERP